MTTSAALGAAAAAVALELVVAYWLYTLYGVRALRPWLGSSRRAGAACAAAASVAAWVMEPSWITSATLAVTLVLVGYMASRQWLIPRPAPTAVPSAQALDGAAEVAVLEGGAALPIAWLARARTVEWGGTWVVHCAIARSLAAFQRPDGAGVVVAVLPHATGFDISDGERTWDGVDGSARGDYADLVRQKVRLTRLADWRAERPEAQLLGPPDRRPIPPARHVVPRVPGARGVDDAMAWGVVVAAEWRPIGERDERDEPGAYYLARWAARARGIRGA